MATKRRRLSDLYILGKMVTFDDGTGDPVSVWLQKINPSENETAIRKANSVRAQVLAAQKDPTSEHYAGARSDLEDYVKGRKGLIQYVCADEEAEIIMATEAELADEEEWKKDGYLQGLKDAWAEGLDETYARDPENEEAKRVFSELERFSKTAEAAYAPRVKDLRESYESLDEDVLLDKACQKYLQIQADIAWMNEFRRCELWLAVRDPDNHRKLYFENREELDELQANVMQRLVQELTEIVIDPDQGKE